MCSTYFVVPFLLIHDVATELGVEASFVLIADKVRGQ
jgi:hypothetical protein